MTELCSEKKRDTKSQAYSFHPVHNRLPFRVKVQMGKEIKVWHDKEVSIISFFILNFSLGKNIPVSFKGIIV
jgi:hypothetical protein